MSCVLRVSGENFDIDDYLSKTDWDGIDLQVFHRGDKLGLKRTADHNGFNMVASEAPFEEFSQQQDNVIAFIKKYRKNLQLLSSYDIDQWKSFDFGLATYPPNQFSKTYLLSPELIKLVADIDMNIVMSNYFTRNDDYLRRRARKHKKAWPVKKLN